MELSSSHALPHIMDVEQNCTYLAISEQHFEILLLLYRHSILQPALIIDNTPLESLRPGVGLALGDHLLHETPAPQQVFPVALRRLVRPILLLGLALVLFLLLNQVQTFILSYCCFRGNVVDVLFRLGADELLARVAHFRVT